MRDHYRLKDLFFRAECNDDYNGWLRNKLIQIWLNEALRLKLTLDGFVLVGNDGWNRFQNAKGRNCLLLARVDS